MSKRMSKVPIANPSKKGPEDQHDVASDATHDERVDDPNTSEQRDTADISQNTTNKAFFHGRRMI